MPNSNGRSTEWNRSWPSNCFAHADEPPHEGLEKFCRRVGACAPLNMVCVIPNYRGLAQVSNRERLKFVAMNLKSWPHGKQTGHPLHLHYCFCLYFSLRPAWTSPRLAAFRQAGSGNWPDCFYRALEEIIKNFLFYCPQNDPFRHI